MRRERGTAVLLAFVSAFSVLLIASSSSPLYATNFWTDTNIYFTIGRGMAKGLMPYTDLFDHKGPLLYMIYAVGALISDTSFIGVFLLEIVSLAAMLCLAYETVSLYGRGPLNFAVIPAAAVVTAACTAFNQGGCAEEFILPALSLALYAVLRRFEEGQDSRRPLLLYVLLGAAMGWVFAIKYTNCGLFFGLAFAGCGFLAFRAMILHRRGFLFEMIAAPCGAGLLLLFTYWGEMAHPYYALVFAALTPLGLCPAAMLARRLKGKGWLLAALVPLAAGIPICMNLCGAVPLMNVDRADMPQVKAAQIVRETPDATLLDWSSLDQGFYLAADIIPSQRYFANNNLDTVEKREAYRACVETGAVDYIVLNSAQTAPGELYELAAEFEGVFDLNNPRSYRLYRLKED